MIDSKWLTKEELIANLWLTNDLMNEINVFEEEIQKKKASLQAIIEKEQYEYLKAIENDYYQSEEYRLDTKYQKLTEKMQTTHNVVALINMTVCTIAGYGFIRLGVPAWQVIIFWLVIPILIYFLYYVWQKYYLTLKKPKREIRPVEDLLQEAKKDNRFQNVHSILTTHIQQEITKLTRKKMEGEQILNSLTVLPKVYQFRAKEVIWLFENVKVDSLKEALCSMDETDHREKVIKVIENQAIEIKAIMESLDKTLKEEKRMREEQERLLKQKDKRRGKIRKKNKKE